MIGLLLVAHAGVASELLTAAEMIVGKLELAEAVGIAPDASATDVMAAIKDAVARVSGDGAIIMTDMFGGTPSNMSISFLQEGKVEVLTGVNLPMLIRFTQERNRCGVAELALKLKESAQEGITVAGDFLKK
ncbi:PTS sugar transporter subunit IIA [Geomonas subterranea]|uniref:PTS sugar transporter n=1 Tax=Geomonas subterranea TaxID=2847989 RepID=A0ABX8LF85_9BACT|nr:MULTISPECIES: PTS sugar transporter [Geomonas]QXE90710.1 PTS sugar transporter [Geomonas subterranea]QXM11208.1 PTS sugar transporter [Geomonas subterranea]